MLPERYDFVRYLASKKTVDDRALNQHVWQTLVQSLPTPDRPLRVLELGAGIGTMVERAVDWGMFGDAHYKCLDESPAVLQEAHARLSLWGENQGFTVSQHETANLELTRTRETISIQFIETNLFDLPRNWGEKMNPDLVMAHAFLDLVDLDRTLPIVFNLLSPGKLFYFSHNFDGVTILHPALDHVLDSIILKLYHQTMDERRIDGKPSGGSRTGRNLSAHLRKSSVDLLSSGTSDWVVLPRNGTYIGDEAFFLHFLVNTIEGAVRGHPELGDKALKKWGLEKHGQIERGELTFIAHQLDFVGRIR